jgi:hypothetical protein
MLQPILWWLEPKSFEGEERSGQGIAVWDGQQVVHHKIRVENPSSVKEASGRIHWTETCFRGRGMVSGTSCGL